MDWLTGIPEVLAVLAGTAVCFAGALWAAQRLDSGAPFEWLFPSRAGPTPEAVIERLAAMADLARSEGILAIEPHAEKARDVLLRIGVHRVAQRATDTELRQELQQALDQAAQEEIRRGTGRRTRLLHVLVVAAAVGGLVSVWHAGIKGVPGRAALVAMAACYASLVALAFVGPLCDRTLGGGAAARVFAGMLSVEAVLLIARGADGAAVRARLSELLPPASRPAQPRAAAA